MNIALINKETNVCENIAVFENMKAAQKMFADKYVITEPKQDYGIGDVYKDGVWSKVEQPQPTPAQQRETAYSTLTHKEDGIPLILWEGEAITVNTAAEKWMFYSSEGSEIANELSAMIVEAKGYIRELYPDNRA